MSETRQLPGAGDYGLLLLLAAIWGSSFVFIKVGVAEVPPVTLTAVRLVLAAVFLLLVMVVSGKRLPSDRQMWVMMAGTALIGNALPFALIAWGQQGIPSNTSAILMGIMPLITIVVAHFFTADETINARKAAGMVTGFIGLVVLVGPEALNGLTASLISQLALLGAATCYGFNAVLVRRMMVRDRLATVAGVMSCAAIMVLPMAFLVETPLAVEAGWLSWAMVAGLGILHTAIATLIMFAIIGRAGASFFGQINLLVPVAGVLWSAALLAERPGFNALAALALIVLGIVIARGGLGLRGRSGGVAKEGTVGS
jgi:drug/metabolite transporter (DMT)-like permease